MFKCEYTCHRYTCSVDSAEWIESLLLESANLYSRDLFQNKHA